MTTELKIIKLSELGWFYFVTLMGVIAFGHLFFAASVFIDVYMHNDLDMPDLLTKWIASVLVGFIWGCLMWRFFIIRKQKKQVGFS